MNIRPWTHDDTLSLIASRGSHQAGDYIEPLIDGHRTVLRVIGRYEGDLGAYAYLGVDKHGRAHYVMRADDPRGAETPCA